MCRDLLFRQFVRSCRPPRWAVWFWLAVFSIAWTGSVSAQLAVNGELTQIFVVEPGQTYRAEITVSNTGDAPTGLDVYQRDYLFFADGRNLYAEAGSVDRSNASWIAFYRPVSVSLDPGQSIPISFVITVPEDPTLVGTYWSLIMVEPKPPPEAPSNGGISLRQVIRYAIQIVTHIGDTGEVSVRVANANLVNIEQGAVLRIDLENIGERWVRPETWADVYDDQGAHVERFESIRQRIYPGCSVRYSIEMPGISSGEYQALVVFDNGDDHVWGAQYTLEL